MPWRMSPTAKLLHSPRSRTESSRSAPASWTAISPLLCRHTSAEASGHKRFLVYFRKLRFSNYHGNCTCLCAVDSFLVENVLARTSYLQAPDAKSFSNGGGVHKQPTWIREATDSKNGELQSIFLTTGPEKLDHSSSFDLGLCIEETCIPAWYQKQQMGTNDCFESKCSQQSCKVSIAY
jgi:hypothetical protein